jgi:putative membrane-bound dehydrogenase-like protein
MRWSALLALLGLLLLLTPVHAADGNRLAYLDYNNPYYVGRTFPRLVTPQWVGEDGVEAVVILGIDDMRGHEKWEKYLRPILERLKKIDGRAPVSIMTCQIDPQHEHLQKWLKEGLSLETHTYDHPCPILKGGDFAKAKGTYDRCVDLLVEVPNNRPVAFRTPCCDSLNTPSPRLFTEIFNKTTEKGNFLTIDTSVFNITTANDPELPRGLVFDPEGRERFRKYVPADRSFVNTIEDYPYPYVLGRLCWEFPCATPSDWQAQYLHKPNNPITVRDWKAAIDATVIKQGVFCLVFHPHNWIKPEQVVELIDHAVEKHGKKVKFLTFKEAQERIDKHLLAGQPLRDPTTGADNGVRLIDLDNDGYLDVVIGNAACQQTRLWLPKERRWFTSDTPAALIQGKGQDAGARFGVVRKDGRATLLLRNETTAGGWHFVGQVWVKDDNLRTGLSTGRQPILFSQGGRDRGVRFRDIDGDGRCELIVANDQQRVCLQWRDEERAWCSLPFALPAGLALATGDGKDNGLRFVDIDEDGRLDVIFSNEERYGVYLFTSMDKGWARQVLAGKRGDKGELPMIAQKGADNGFWVHSRHLWWQNEHTALLPNLVDRRAFNDLLRDVEPGPKSPEASLRSIRVRPGFQVELVAAEPLVQDPIALAWGPDGKLWVVEMGDYPLGTDAKGKPGGKVKYLEDTDGDGKYDRATVFLDGLPFPTSVLPWKKGVLVTCAPDIFYAEDTDGDGKADGRRVLFTGFGKGNQQHRVNSLVWGLDNWVYCANGDSGGKITMPQHERGIDDTSPKRERGPINISGRDFRIRPDEGLLDLQAGQTQFGRSRDDWGNWFGNNNSWPMWHFVLADHYIRRNPHLAVGDPRVQVSVTPGAATVYPISRTLPRFNSPESANHFTSACGTIVYRDDLFGPAFAGSTFVSEPVHNLVHRELMTAQGATFSSRRAADEQTSEFLAASDNWFRPTSLATGPDGALWVADMYRLVIEHPQWIPKDWQQRLDLRAGHDRGRIYRVFPVGAKPRAIPRLDRLDTAGLVAALDSPSGWQRDMAQMMLIWKQDRAAVAPLEKLATDCHRPLARLHALCTLDGLGALTPALLKRALTDPHPGVRRHAVRLCEPLLGKAPELGEALATMTDDADAQVRMQLAYTLGEWKDPRAGRALGRMALREAGDRWLSAAVMSSVHRDNLDAVLLTVMADPKGPPPAAVAENLLRMASALNHGKALAALLYAVGTPEKERYAPWQTSALAGLLDALDQRDSSLARLGESGDAEVKAALQRVAGLFDAARATLAKKEGSKEDQLQAIRLLGRGLDQQAKDMETLAGLLVPQTPDDVQAAVIAALGRLRGKEVAAVLVRGWKSYGPALRGQVLDALFRRDDWLRALLDNLERKEVSPAELDAARRQRLLAHKDPGIRQRASRLFADAISPDRQKLIDAYQPALKLTGDPRRGTELFKKHCAACHKLGDVGHVVGPDLASVGDKSPQGLMIAILDPNRVVEARYVNYTALTRNGQTFTGVLASETGNSITLLAQEGKQQVILRSDLEELISTGKSAMPEGLEKDIKPQDLADLIAYLRSVGPVARRKTFPGNNPEVVKPDKEGALLLSAATAEIYGTSLVLEKQHGNLGYWTSDDDHAVWTVRVPRTGRYAVWLDWACPPESAGKPFLLDAGANQLTNKVASTGSWDTYRQERVGELVLTAGEQRLTFRAARRLYASPLLDLKAIKLVPVASE